MIFPSQQRKESMALAFAELDKVANPVICEVGRLRNPMAGESDGHSTLAFLDYVNGRTGQLISIDNSSGTEDACRKLFYEKSMDTFRLSYSNEDAIGKYSTCWNAEIDLLYLDGWDLTDPDSARNHLMCFLIAEPFLASEDLVLVDDTGYPDLGKGKLVVPVAVLMGWTVLHQGFQTLLRKTI